MYNLFKDIIKVCCSRSLFETLIIENKDGNVVIKANDKRNANLKLSAFLKNSPKELSDTYILSSLDYLKGIINNPIFTDDDQTTLTIEDSEELKLSASNGSRATYRMMNKKLYDALSKSVGIFRSNSIASWESTIDLDTADVSSFLNIASLYKENEKSIMSIGALNKKLTFGLGENNSDRHADIIFDEFSKDFPSFDVNLSMLIDCLSLAKSCGNSKMKISSHGVVIIEIDTEYAVYNFVMTKHGL